jgi:hypothetical protein
LLMLAYICHLLIIGLMTSPEAIEPEKLRLPVVVPEVVKEYTSDISFFEGNTRGIRAMSKENPELYKVLSHYIKSIYESDHDKEKLDQMVISASIVYELLSIQAYFDEMAHL